MVFQGLMDCMWKKLRRWKRETFVEEGSVIKDVIQALPTYLKGVIQALPTYLMGVYKLPTSIIHSAMARFWWEGKGEETKMHCRPKCMGYGL